MTGRGLIKRLYLMVVFILISCFLVKVIYHIWWSHVNRPLSFTVDTNYLNWTTTFPAISICEIYNTEKTWDLNEQIYGENRNKDLDDVISDVAFFSGLCYSCRKCAKNPAYCSKLSLTNITNKFRATCKNLLTDCQWNGEPFDCCDGFLALQSEFGVCYTINSMHTKPQWGKKLISNRETGPGVLQLITLEDVELYLHSTEDIPSKSMDKNLHETVLWGGEKEILFGVEEILNEDDVQHTSVAHRRCQFNWEKIANRTDQIFDYYSYSTCMVQCNFEIQLQTCGCVHHLMPKGGRSDVPTCGFEGLICLTEHYELINERRKKECKCMISCTEQEINIVYSSNDLSYYEIGTKVKIGMLSLPKMRYIRKTVRSWLDFIISLGGIVGLLYGASIITIVELLFKIYWRFWAK